MRIARQLAPFGTVRRCRAYCLRLLRPLTRSVPAPTSARPYELQDSIEQPGRSRAQSGRLLA